MTLFKTISPPLDHDTLQELRDIGGEDGPENFLSIIEQFLYDLSTYVETVQQAIIHSDSNALMKAAHTFKGSARHIGEKYLAELCFLWEQLRRNETFDRAQENLDQLVQKTRQVLSFFQSNFFAHDEERL